MFAVAGGAVRCQVLRLPERRTVKASLELRGSFIMTDGALDFFKSLGVGEILRIDIIVTAGTTHLGMDTPRKESAVHVKGHFLPVTLGDEIPFTVTLQADLLGLTDSSDQGKQEEDERTDETSEAIGPHADILR